MSVANNFYLPHDQWKEILINENKILVEKNKVFEIINVDKEMFDIDMPLDGDPMIVLLRIFNNSIYPYEKDFELSEDCKLLTSYNPEKGSYTFSSKKKWSIRSSFLIAHIKVDKLAASMLSGKTDRKLIMDQNEILTFDDIDFKPLYESVKRNGFLNTQAVMELINSKISSTGHKFTVNSPQPVEILCQHLREGYIPIRARHPEYFLTIQSCCDYELELIKIPSNITKISLEDFVAGVLEGAISNQVEVEPNHVLLFTDFDINNFYALDDDPYNEARPTARSEGDRSASEVFMSIAHSKVPNNYRLTFDFESLVFLKPMSDDGVVFMGLVCKEGFTMTLNKKYVVEMVWNSMKSQAAVVTSSALRVMSSAANALVFMSEHDGYRDVENQYSDSEDGRVLLV